MALPCLLPSHLRAPPASSTLFSAAASSGPGWAPTDAHQHGKVPVRLKSFPIFQSLSVRDYGLYPGAEGGKPGLHVRFRPGLTLVVGANGLGKTTLITLMFRMLVGAFDIPQLGVGDELGFRRLAAGPVTPTQRSMFAARVADRAATATATLEYRLGSATVAVERRLDTLALRSATLGGLAFEDEAAFQAAVAEHAGLGSFGDFILMLRYLVFYFEDRRQLVWDASAQRQLLRMLFLPPDVALRWTEMERSILQNDSRMRNFQAVVGKAEKMLAGGLAKASAAGELRAELQALEALQDPARQKLEDLERLTDELDRRRQDARLLNQSAKQERESRFRALEHAKLVAIEARFPGRLETGRYMIAHLMTEESCLVCGSHAPEAARMYAHRLEGGRCVVCDSDLSRSESIVEPREVADERVSKADRLLGAADRELVGSARERESSEADFDRHTADMTLLRSEIATRSARLSQIIDLLPPDEAVLRNQRTELAAIRGTLEEMKADLVRERLEFRGFVEDCTAALLSSSGEVVDEFERFAGTFLSERVSLTWTSRSVAVGQGGEAIPFPAFELNMTGSDFGDTVRRAGPGDVSESQREFIDLAFRMALMKVAGGGASGLVIDTPESSLDAVFARRAADTLLRFGQQDGNGVLVTSNLVEGSLLPTLVQAIARSRNKKDRLVDLFKLARPTAAVAADRAEYDEFRRKLLGPLL